MFRFLLRSGDLVGGLLRPLRVHSGVLNPQKSLPESIF